ncbi:MAG: hypothetical protein JNM78_15760 [Cyclobacteriaceae bacterium]|nr:hypothetical protein [Cyclobacteriaceae bacterium]
MRLIQPVSLVFFMLMFSVGFSQRIVNLTYLMQVDEGGRKYLINYDIQSRYDNIPSRVRVKLTAEMNGVSNSFYLKEVSGDVGDLIYPGANKKIIWDHQKELIHFSGEINLEIESTPAVMVSKSARRGREIVLSVGPGFGTNEISSVKLFRAGHEIMPVPTGALKDGVLPVLIPKKSKVKKNFQLAIQQDGKSYFSNSFKVKRKFSFGWVIFPALGVSAYLAISKILEAGEPLPGPPGSGLPDGD